MAGIDNFMNALAGFGAGVQGQGQQFLAAQKDMKNRDALAKLVDASGSVDPGQILLEAAKIDPKYLASYASYQSNAPYRQLQALMLGQQLGAGAVTTSPTVTNPLLGGQQPQAPAAQGEPLAPLPGGGQPPAQSPVAAPAIQPLYKGGLPATEGADKGYMWGMDPRGVRVQMPIPGGDVEKAKAANIDAAMTNINLIDQMIGRPSKGDVPSMPEHPGLERAVGPIQSQLPTLSGDVADFEALLEQAQGGAFLTAIAQLKGLGALSNVEGQAATGAITRMRTSQSEEGFRKAAAEYRDIVERGVARAQGREMPEAPSAPASAPQSAPATIDFNTYKAGFKK